MRTPICDRGHANRVALEPGSRSHRCVPDLCSARWFRARTLPELRRGIHGRLSALARALQSRRWRLPGLRSSVRNSLHLLTDRCRARAVAAVARQFAPRLLVAVGDLAEGRTGERRDPRGLPLHVDELGPDEIVLQPRDRGARGLRRSLALLTVNLLATLAGCLHVPRGEILPLAIELTVADFSGVEVDEVGIRGGPRHFGDLNIPRGALLEVRGCPRLEGLDRTLPFS